MRYLACKYLFWRYFWRFFMYVYTYVRIVHMTLWKTLSRVSFFQNCQLDAILLLDASYILYQRKKFYFRNIIFGIFIYDILKIYYIYIDNPLYVLDIFYIIYNLCIFYFFNEKYTFHVYFWKFSTKLLFQLLK